MNCVHGHLYRVYIIVESKCSKLRQRKITQFIQTLYDMQCVCKHNGLDCMCISFLVLL